MQLSFRVIKCTTALLASLLLLFAADADPVVAKESEAADIEGLSNQIQTLYNDQNGLPTREANTVLQTKDGYIWIGSYGGLVRYDGKTFRNYSTEEDGLNSFGIRALWEDDLGQLWVGTNDLGVFLYKNNQFITCQGPDTNIFKSARCFAQDQNKTMFVGTSTGLAIIDEELKLVDADIPELKNQTIYTLSFDENGVLWGTAGAGIVFALKEDKVLYWMEAGKLSPSENYSVLADGETIYIGTADNVLIRLILTDKLYTEHSFSKTIYETGDIASINSMYLTADKKLWLCANTGAAYFNEKMKFYQQSQLGEGIFLSAMMEDYEGNLWIASTKYGVFKLTMGKFLRTDANVGMDKKPINAVVRLDGVLYSAADDGLIILDEKFKPIENDLTKMLSGERVRHLSTDKAGNLWISTYSDYGVLCCSPDTGKVQTFTEADGLLSNKVRETIQLQNGDIAVATMNGINIIHNSKISASYGIAEGMVNPVILCLTQSEDGTLLAGSDGMGIYAIKDGKIKNIGRKEGLSAGVVLRIEKDEEVEGIWISAGSRLYFGNKDGIKEITEFNIGIGSVFDIKIIGDEVWLLKSSGVIVVKRDCLLGKRGMSFTEYGRDCGLSTGITANSWSLLEDGMFYLCTGGGVLMLDTKRIPQSLTPPKAAVNQIVVEDENSTVTTYQNPHGLKLPSTTRRITVYFACLSYVNSSCKVQYYLEGFDQKPTLVSAQQVESVSYTNLSGGSYVFRMNALNADGILGRKEVSVTIEKELKLYEHAIFWWLAALAVLVAAVVIVRLFIEVKTRKIRKRQQEYKEITDQALQTIANTIDAKDKYTNGHSMRVAGYSREISRRLGYTETEQEKIYYIALMHDIGKIGIPDAILNKPGKLTEEEFEIMKSHTLIGGHILGDFTALPNICDGATGHHEKFGGGGYPFGLKADEIPAVARIICAADSYDAMATKRSYREPQSEEYIISEFEDYSGIQFEPKISKIIIEMIKEGFNP